MKGTSSVLDHIQFSLQCQATPDNHHCPLLGFTCLQKPCFPNLSMPDTQESALDTQARLRKSQPTDFTTGVWLYPGHSVISVSVVQSEVIQSHWKRDTGRIKTQAKVTDEREFWVTCARTRDSSNLENGEVKLLCQSKSDTTNMDSVVLIIKILPWMWTHQ